MLVLMIKFCSSNQIDPPPPISFNHEVRLTCGVPTSQLPLVMSENKKNLSLIY